MKSLPLDNKQISLIGVHGPLNGGKDTVANYYQAKFPDRFARYAFARPIKQACTVLFGFTSEQMEDRTLKEQDDAFWGFSPRKAMQKLGTEYGRDMLRDDVWIKRAELELEKNKKIGKGLIITDVRFENEAKWIRSVPNAIIIYLHVPGLQKDARYAHASEAGIEYHADFDILVENDKTKGLPSLFSILDGVLK